MLKSTRLIPDWETDSVFIVLPEKHSYYRYLHPFYNNLLKILAKREKVTCFTHDKSYTTISGINYIEQKNLDIWIRDFAPILTNDELYQYLYMPNYQVNECDKQDLVNTVIETRHSFSEITKNYKLKKLDIIADGGNFSHNGKILIVSKKIYENNPDIPSKEINSVFYRMGAKKIISIPYDAKDIIGHADGMVKWINKDSLFVACFENIELTKRIKNIIFREIPNIKIISMPIKYNRKNNFYNSWEDVSGLYINFLQTKNAVYIPIFKQNQDNKIIDLMNKTFDKPIEFIDARMLSKYGGLLNCITWNYSSDILYNQLKNNSSVA